MKQECKLISFIKKYDLQYFLLYLSVFVLKGILYFVVKAFPTTIHRFHMDIDGIIPFCKYFYVFYISYYIVPEIYMWRLARRDRAKYWKLFIGAVIGIVVCFICFIVYQVQMVRPEGYPMDIALSDVKNVSDLFDFAISCQYIADAGALNCFPSLHALIGMMMVLLGLKLPGDKEQPLWFRISSVIIGAGIICSTVFVKQHYFIDSATSVVLMTLAYIAAHFVVKNCINKRCGKVKKQ